MSAWATKNSGSAESTITHAHFVVGGDLRRRTGRVRPISVRIQQVDRWVVDRRAADAVADRDSKLLVVVVGHGKTVCDAVVTCSSSGYHGA